jgi:nucleoside-diphosphate-sugar epimerase
MQLGGRKVLVTGGAGLIGSYLAERLVAAGAGVVVADDFSRGRREHLAGIVDRIEVREGDLERPEVMELALEGAEVIFHLASRVYGVGYGTGRHLAILEHNDRITNNLIGALARRPPAWLVIASSSCVYPDDGPERIPELPLFVGEPEAVNCGYGWAKRMLEQKALLLAREKGIALTIVRPFNIYGERYRWAGDASQAVPMQMKKVMDGDDPVVIWGSGRQRRNYLHAIDCADAIAGLVEADFAGTVNIGTEDTVTLRELVELMCRLSHRRPALVYDLSRPEGRLVKSSDSTRLRREYPQFRTSIDLEQGILRMIGWYRRNFGERAA